MKNARPVEILFQFYLPEICYFIKHPAQVFRCELIYILIGTYVEYKQQRQKQRKTSFYI